MSRTVVQLNKYCYPRTGGIETVVNMISDLLHKNDISCINLVHEDIEIKSYVSEKIINSYPLFRVKNIPVCLPNLKAYKACLKSTHVIYHHPNPSFLLIFLFLCILQKKVYIFWHCNSSSIFGKFIDLIFCNIARLNKNKRFIFTSKNYYSLVKKRYIRSSFEPYDICHLATDKMITNIRRPKTFKFFTLGRLVSYKNISHAIDTMSYLPQNFQLSIIGDGPLKNALDEHIETLGLRSRVRLLGYLDDKQLPYFMNDQDGLFFPSNSEAEAFGISQIDAALAGNFIIRYQSLNTGVSEILNYDDMIVAAGNTPMETASNIERYYADCENMEDLREIIHQRARHYSAENFHKQIFGILKLWDDGL